MELNQIRYFLEVAESQHITKSAEKLHIAQPSLTQAIHRFEESIGVPLFTSKGRNIVLNEYGKYLSTRLAPIINELDKIPEEVQTLAHIQNNTINLNVLAASSIVTEAIIAYKKVEKNVNFHLMQNNETDLFDIEITTKMSNLKKENETFNNKERYFAKENQYICNEKIYLAVPNNVKYKHINSIALSNVKEEGFISIAGTKQFSAICEKICQNVGFKPKMIFESDNQTSVKNMIMANIGVGFWPEFTWGDIDTEHVKLLEIEEFECQREIAITCNLNKLDNNRVLDFYEYLKKWFNDSKKKEKSDNAINI